RTAPPVALTIPTRALCPLLSYAARRDLHSFPTRRSSDLAGRAGAAGGRRTRLVDRQALRQRRDEPGRAVAGGARGAGDRDEPPRSEEHTSELQSRENLVCRLLLEKKKTKTI